MTGTKNLTPAQHAMLVRLAHAPELTPGGNREQARLAANWYRTLAVLTRHGLATRQSAGGGCLAKITAFGLKVYQGTGVVGSSKSDATRP